MRAFVRSTIAAFWTISSGVCLLTLGLWIRSQWTVDHFGHATSWQSWAIRDGQKCYPPMHGKFITLDSWKSHLSISLYYESITQEQYIQMILDGQRRGLHDEKYGGQVIVPPNLDWTH